ncbi:MAG: beta-ketoacyl-ACP synthase [Gammaproteobacteria bacterium]
MRIPIEAYTLTSALGAGLDATADALWQSRSGLTKNDFPHSGLDTCIGRVAQADGYVWPDGHERWHSRNNALTAIGLMQDGFFDVVAQARDRYGRHRVGIVIGTSTSSIGRTEEGYRDLIDDARMPDAFHQPEVHNPHSPSAYVAHLCDLGGPQITVSTACASSARVFASAARWLALDLVDAVVVGGVDSLCLSVLHGFNSLELLSPSPCRPFDKGRDGINLSEAAGFALLLQEGHTPTSGAFLSGYGESGDAWHMSHPHPEGYGAELAMRGAIDVAGLEAAQIGYINLHGTASQANDDVEAHVLARVFDEKTLASSTKGWTGHALGAAGIVESVIALLALRDQKVPGTLNLNEPDPEFPFSIQRDSVDRPLNHVMTNSFGFGGSNCSLVFSAGAA